ncbi:MAG TPA: fasciclin domain-containing protein, partial [Polyangiaceae bacterium]
MKYLPWMGVMLVATQSLVACSEDSSEGDGGGGTSGSGGSTSTGGKSSGGTGGSSAGKSSTTAGSSSTDGGTPATGGVASGGAGGAGGEVAAMDIVDTAVAAGNFSQLAAALTAAGLVDALKGEGPFTVFAPDDDAFDAFEAENPGVLAGLSKAALGDVLKYHVIAGAAAQSSGLK